MKNLPFLTNTDIAEARLDDLCNCLIPMENKISHLLVSQMIINTAAQCDSSYFLTQKCSIKPKNFVCSAVVGMVLGLGLASGRHFVTLTQGSIYNTQTLLNHTHIHCTYFDKVCPSCVRNFTCNKGALV